jgi:hypothetical protein
MSSYPIGYEADFAVERSRLTTFFRYFMAIPLMVVSLFYGIALMFSYLFAFLAVLFTAKYPAGLYEFNGNVIRFFTRSSGYMRLQTDVYPPMGLGEFPEYPIRVPIAPAQASYSRLKVFFRFILAIPVELIGYALNLLGGIAAFCSWFVIVFTGKQSEGLQDALNLSLAYQARMWGYMLYMTESYPPFSPKQIETQAAPAPGTEPAAS